MHCLVLWCSNKGKIPGINYFCLTKKRHDAWLMALGRDPYVQQLSERNVICSKHFSPEDILYHHNGKRIRLRPNAVPKFYLRKRDYDLEQGSSRAFQEMHQEGDDLFEEFPVKIEKHDLDLDSYDSCNYSHEKIYMDDFEAQFLDDKKYIPGLSTSCSPSLETAQSSHSLETSAPEESATDSEDDKEKTKTAIQEILIRHNYWKDSSQEENIDNENRPNLLSSSARPMRAAKVKCLGNISKNINEERSYNETVEQREQRLEDKRQRYLRHVANETVEQREQRLEKQRQRRANETVEQREQHLEDKRKYASRRMANETVEQREQRLEKVRQRENQRRANETIEQREQRLEDRRKRASRCIANETVEKRKQRLEVQRQFASRQRANETVEQRERRLEKGRQRINQRLTNETVEQREQRLEAQRQRYLRRIANETVEEREQRINKLRQRRANETVEQRELRLEARRQFPSRRMAVEIVDKRVEFSLIPTIALLPKLEVKFFTAPDVMLRDDSRVAPNMSKIPEAGSDVLCQPD